MASSNKDEQIEDEKFVESIPGFIRDLEKKQGKLSYPIPIGVIDIIGFFIREPRAIVIDNGDYKILAGYAGDDAPKLVYKPDCSWGDNMEKVWECTFKKLKLKINHLQYYTVFMTEPPLNPKENREKMTKIMFEKFNVKKFYLASAAELALLASGRRTGLILSSGHGSTYSVPMYEKVVQKDAIRKVNIGGKHVTDYLTKLISEQDSKHKHALNSKIAEDIKRKLCYVAAAGLSDEMTKFEAEKQDITKHYVLPDGKVMSMDDIKKLDVPDDKVVVVGDERFKAPEILFQPILLDDEDVGVDGIHMCLYHSIMNCDVDMRRDLLTNIVLAGGNTLIPGFEERLCREMTALSPISITVKIAAFPFAVYLSWIGGSIVSSLESFQENESWITRAEYEEFGCDIVHKKCVSDQIAG